MLTEQKFQKKLIDQYEASGYYVIKLTVTNKNGIPDLLCLKPDKKPLFIEVKKTGGKVSAIQSFRIKELTKFGFDAIVKYPEE